MGPRSHRWNAISVWDLPPRIGHQGGEADPPIINKLECPRDSSRCRIASGEWREGANTVSPDPFAPGPVSVVVITPAGSANTDYT
jgi:hypothetical protein